MSSREIKHYTYGDVAKQELEIKRLEAEIADAYARLKKLPVGTARYFAAHFFCTQADERYEDANKEYQHMLKMMRS